MHSGSTTGVLAMQLAVAAASPHAWRDGIVVARHDDVLEVALLDGGTVALSVETDAEPGTPVALHPVAELLAAGSSRSSARPV